MIPLQIYITEYNETASTCKAKLRNGNYIELDPFVGCAIEQSHEEYERGEGHNLVGSVYLMTEYTVYKHNVVPSEGGLVEL